MNLYLRQKIKAGNLNAADWQPHVSFWWISMFPINFYYHLKNFALQNQSLNYFNHSIKNVPDKFHFFIGFLQVK